MSGSEVRIYADIEDHLALFQKLNQLGNYVYISTLSEIDQPPITFRDAMELRNYLRCTPMTSNASSFLVMPSGSKINFREIKMQAGGIKIKVDNAFNQNATVIKLGGELPKILIATSLNTTGETAVAKKEFKRLKAAFTKNAFLVKGFYVHPNALKMWESGWRLTPEPHYSSSEDLIA